MNRRLRESGWIFCAAVLALASGLFSPGIRAQSGAIEEIIVTAERRESNVQDVASTIDVFAGETLDALGVDNLEDYLTRVTGLGMTSLGAGKPKIGMRGITNNAENQFGFTDSSDTVGIYLDDIPISGSGPTPDLNVYDLDRIEVLKGPQGTLYGEGAMGGAIRMITRAPDFERFDARADLTYGSIGHGGSKFRARTALNAPLVQERVALRITGSYVDDGGFIDHIVTGEKNVNSSELESVRVQLALKPSDSVHLNLSYLHNGRKLDNFNEMAPGAGDLNTVYLEPRFLDSTTDIFGLTARVDLGFAELSSITSYNENDYRLSDRLVAFSAGLNFVFMPVPLLLQESFPIDATTDTFTQEIRLVSKGDEFVDWVVGGFYRNRKTDLCLAFELPGLHTVSGGLFALIFGISTEQQASCQTPGMPFLLSNDMEEDFEQVAGYAEVKIAVQESLDLILGLRVFDEKIRGTAVATHSAISAAFLGVSPPLVISDSASDVLFKAGLSYYASDDLLLYALVSEGFRSGGGNFNVDVTGTAIPGAYGPDKIINYEIGAKSSWLENRLILNVSGYYNDWSDIQTILTQLHPQLQQPVSFTDNVGDAEAYGFDVQVIARFNEHFSGGLNYSLTKTELTSASPFSLLTEGEDLANSPENTLSAYLQAQTAFAGGELYGRADVVYVDDQVTQSIGVNTPRSFFGVEDYALLHLRLGWQRDELGVEVFGENLTDKRNQLGISSINAGLNTIVGTPRTIGVTVRVGL